MGYNTNSQRNTAAASETNWKAQGFLNLYLPSKDGKRRKLAGIPLKDNKPNEQSMREWLEKDPGNVAILLSKLIIEYQPAAQSEGSAFALG